MSYAKDNGKKISAVLAGKLNKARLFRTAVAGPSGQRRDIHVGTIQLPDPDDFLEHWSENCDLVISKGNDVLGYADQGYGGWLMFSYEENYGKQYVGKAESLALGCDVLLHGEHAATGRHDSRRISQGRWEPSQAYKEWVKETYGLAIY